MICCGAFAVFNDFVFETDGKFDVLYNLMMIRNGKMWLIMSINNMDFAKQFDGVGDYHSFH